MVVLLSRGSQRTEEFLLPRACQSLRVMGSEVTRLRVWPVDELTRCGIGDTARRTAARDRPEWYA
jgi:hypothetical protein